MARAQVRGLGCMGGMRGRSMRSVTLGMWSDLLLLLLEGEEHRAAMIRLAKRRRRMESQRNMRGTNAWGASRRIYSRAKASQFGQIDHCGQQCGSGAQGAQAQLEAINGLAGSFGGVIVVEDDGHDEEGDQCDGGHAAHDMTRSGQLGVDHVNGNGGYGDGEQLGQVEGTPLQDHLQPKAVHRRREEKKVNDNLRI